MNQILFFEVMFTKLLNQSLGLPNNNYLGIDLDDSTTFQSFSPSIQGILRRPKWDLPEEGQAGCHPHTGLWETF